MTTDARRPPGAIILVHGASSAGKSTLCRALQQRIDAPFWHYSIDHLRDAGVLPRERISSGEFAWRDMRAAFFDGFHRSVGVFARAGNNLIVEHIVETREWLADLLAILSGIDVFFVAVHCPLAELERREAARGDRPLGMAKADFESVHAFNAYDLEIDSTAPLDANVEALIAAWKRRRPPGAFERMARRPSA